MHISNICVPQSRPPSDFFQNRLDHVTPLPSPHLADKLRSSPHLPAPMARQHLPGSPHLSPASPVPAQAPAAPGFLLLRASCCSSDTPVPPTQGLCTSLDLRVTLTT